ncbi:hypothetical protein OOT46_25815 [Aquabacterium sp. A7-Y]|uniref:hypothetical protein n=1 Tax=Aquabacterium sp. A7-Y TaxID=1349605 RepID=UPI00223DE2E4|nr:hypothetical protein [Aquabacterium sp. A7-Y]MCW7541232.1 hypothetical protein [Aquabacterium sp. A7-Y]
MASIPTQPSTPATAADTDRPARPARKISSSWWTRLREQLWLPLADVASSAVAERGTAVATSGFPALDAVLPAGGWPAAGVVEVLAPQPGHPELALLSPVLCSAASHGQRTALLGQPEGIVFDPSQGCMATPGARAATQASAPAAETLPRALSWLRAGRGGVLAVWLPELKTAELRDLQRAARRAHTTVFAVRPWSAHWDDSEADLRVSLFAGKGGRWEVRVHLQPGAAAPTVRVPALGPAPARHLRVVQDPSDHRRTLLSGSLIEVCRELDRLAALECAAETSLPGCRLVAAV